MRSSTLTRQCDSPKYPLPLCATFPFTAARGSRTCRLGSFQAPLTLRLSSHAADTRPALSAPPQRRRGPRLFADASTDFNMPLMEISDVQAQAALAALEPEFLALMEAKQVPVELQALIGHLGVTRLTTFAHLEADEVKIREMMKADFGLDPSEGIRARIHMASMVETWKAARQRVQVAEEAAAEARAVGKPRELMAPQASSLRRAYTTVHGKLEDEEWPCRDYLAWRFAQFEEGEFRAENLTDVVDMTTAGDDGADPSFSMLLTPSGKVATMRHKVKTDPPKNPEQLRRFYRLMSTHWQVMRQVYPNRRVVAHASTEVWNHLVTYLLGPRVAEYRSRHNVRISWAGLLEYEFRIRKQAMLLMTEQGMELDTALRTAWTDPVLENRYFTLELVTSGEKVGSASGINQEKGDGKTGSKRALDRELAEVKKLRSQLEQSLKSSNTQHGGSSSSGGAKGGGKGSAGKKGGLTIKMLNELRKKETLATRARGSAVMICTFFQLKTCNRGAECSYDHICLRCHQPGHGIFDCTATPRAKGSK